MSILIKGINIPKCSNEDCIVVIRRDKAEVWQTGYKERTVEAIQIPDALVSAWEDYKQTATIISKVGRKTFAHKVFELEAEE